MSDRTATVIISQTCPRSNFDGTWERYLEDFIELAYPGLNGIWSNTVGFPKTRDLFL